MALALGRVSVDGKGSASLDRERLEREANACLGEDRPAGELVECISAHFPEVDVYRENDDLVIKGGGRYLVVRRTGRDRFRVTENVAVPSTNVVDRGGGAERSLAELIDEIAALAE